MVKTEDDQGYMWGGCRAAEITSGPIFKGVFMFQDINQLWILSDIMAFHRDAAHTKTRFCLNQDLSYLFTVLSLKHY